MDFVELKKGDNDAKKKWGGNVVKDTPVYTVSDLQKDLKFVGVFTETGNGIFGPKTEKALKIFQWACANLDKCLTKGNLTDRPKKSSIIANGILKKASYDELSCWVSGNQKVTGDLLRFSFSELTNVEAGPNFKKLSSAIVQKSELVLSKGAKDLLTDLSAKAKEKSVTIKINQAFREHGLKVTGAVVAPASKSQHLIGHALDCNIVDGASWNNSSNFKNKKETESAKSIIKKLKKLGYRWGGDFTPVDTPHFDSKLDSNSFAYEAKFFLNQRSISEAHPIPKGKI